ncbi:MAG TPA: MerR family transcriptional regulator [Vicinamibacterales bacterium]|jgi:DNA-binding transcriptional MerR regulator
MSDEVRYAIDDLAGLADVSRRTVRYYVQEGLIPAPLGVGRGRHYGKEHLERLLEVKAQQAAGRTLDEIRATVMARRGPKAVRRETPMPERSVWRRLQLAPGLELHVAGHVTLPPPGLLGELADWCRLHFTSSSDE